MKVVGIGGGTGLPVLLQGLKNLNSLGGEHIDITAIVAVSDSGGSTGMLRQALKMPAMGDIRNCLTALAGSQSTLAALCQHRFEQADGLAGHSVGNLILSALYQMSGNFGAAVKQAADLLDVRGCVLPVSETPLTLCAAYDDGVTVIGEADITNISAEVVRVWVDPANPIPSPGVLRALDEADAIVMGPGSLYTSVIPNLLVGGVGRAIHEAHAIKIYVCNLMTQPGETGGYTAADHLRHLQSYLPPRTIDVCILNTSHVGNGLAKRYSRSGSEAVVGTEMDIREMGVIPVAAPLLSGEAPKVRHDPEVLARLIVSLARDAMSAAWAAIDCPLPLSEQKVA